MLSPLRILFFYLAAPPLLLACILIYAIDDTPIIQTKWTLTRQDIERAKHIVSKSPSKNSKTIHLGEKDLNIALSYLLNYYIPSTSKVLVRKDFLDFTFSLLLSKDNLFGKYLNIRFKLAKQQGFPIIQSLQIGRIKIADEFAGLILESIIKYTPLKEYYILASKHIRDIQISSKGITITYITSDEFDFTKNLGLNIKDYNNVVFYQRQISKIVAEHNPKWRLSLAKLLQPLFSIAYQRSTEDTAIAENRAVLIAISSYVNRSEIKAYLPFDLTLKTDKDSIVSMYQRKDMAQHFMISAALAAAGAETLAYILGQEKEISDAQQGSGFSFIDLASDRAGLKFGKTAIASPAKARKLQQHMANIKDYSAFMPDVTDLPENMSDHVFKQKFESIYSRQYQNMLKKIDQRIANLQIYN